MQRVRQNIIRSDILSGSAATIDQSPRQPTTHATTAPDDRQAQDVNLSHDTVGPHAIVPAPSSHTHTSVSHSNQNTLAVATANTHHSSDPLPPAPQNLSAASHPPVKGAFSSAGRPFPPPTFPTLDSMLGSHHPTSVGVTVEGSAFDTAHHPVTVTVTAASAVEPLVSYRGGGGGDAKDRSSVFVGNAPQHQQQHAPTVRHDHPAVHPPQAFLETPTRFIVWRRLRVLISLLILQSLSQIVLQAFEGLITVNVVVPLFLTMLVGAGGNAGNQAAVTAITGLTSGELTRWDAMRIVKKEAIVGFICALALGVMGFIRVFVFYVSEDETPAPVFTTVFAISLSLFLIVFSSVVLGGALPFVLKRFNANVEHAAPMIQVIMDILGVTICCVVCSFFLPSSLPPPATTGNTDRAANSVNGAAGASEGGKVGRTFGSNDDALSVNKEGASFRGGRVGGGGERERNTAASAGIPVLSITHGERIAAAEAAAEVLVGG